MMLENLKNNKGVIKLIMMFMLVTLFMMLSQISYAAASDMITEWTIPSGDTTIKLPVKGIGLNIIVDWGDGTTETITGDITAENFPTHTYSTSGEYDISIRGTCPKWGYNGWSAITETSPYYTYTQYLTKVKQFGELSATQYGFSQCANLKYVSGDATENTFTNVTNMAYMFYNCSSLTSLDLSNFDTSNVTDMKNMFYKCSSLTSLDVSSFNTSNVTDMEWMFSGCESLTSLDLSNFITSNVTRMANMFYNCSSLTSLDVSSFNTSNVTDMEWMFSGCESLTSLDLSNFITSNVTRMANMFYNCSSLTSLDVSSFNTSNVTDMEWMFSGCESLTSLDLSNFITSNVTRMANMFYNCSSLTSLDVSSFNTSNVTDMEWMFSGCESLTSLDLSNFITSNVTRMANMFYNCSSLTSLDVSSFNTSNVTDMHEMFSYCESLITLDLKNFDTSNVTDMGLMFRNCSSLTSLDVSNFNTSNVTDMHSMFYNCTALNSLQLSNKFAIPTSGDDTSVYANIFGRTSKLSAIIIIDETPLASQFTNVKDQLDGKTFYVPNETAETSYESSWNGDFTADRIKPILELVGETSIEVNKGSSYSDAGYTVAGFDTGNSENYTAYGYSVTSTGSVNTSTVGTYTIKYTLKRNYTSSGTNVTDDVATVTRTVNVVEIGPITGSVKIVGDNRLNNMLTAVMSELTPSDATLSYQWYYNTSDSTTGGTKITGATEESYILTNSEVGKYIYVEVTASASGYETTTFKDITDATENSNSTVQSDNTGNKSDGYVILTYTRGYVASGTATKSFTVADHHGGTLSAEELTSYGVSFTITGTTIKVSGLAGLEAGTLIRIRVTSSETDTYTEAYEDYYLGIGANFIIGRVSIDGENTVGQTLTANVSTITPTGCTYTYQWYEIDYPFLSLGTAISGATQSTYVPTEEQIGKFIYVIVKATKTNYYDAYFADITTAFENNTWRVSGTKIAGKVSVSGIPNVGEKLTAVTKGITPTGCDFSYQWWTATSSTATSGTNIYGATSSTYTLTSSQVGKYIGVTVTASKTNYTSKTFTSSVIGPVTEATKETGYVTLSSNSGTVTAGTASKTFTIASNHGGTLTVTETTSTAAEVAISGTTVTISNLGSLTAGTTVKVRVTCAATDTYTEAYADYTLTVEEAAVTISGSVSIDGTTEVGRVLTANTDSVTPTGCTFTYQWYSSSYAYTSFGSTISGVASKTYTIPSSMVGKYIYVKVTATKGSASKTFTSSVVGKVTEATKETGYVTLSENSGSIVYGTASKTFTIASSHGGTLTAAETTTNGVSTSMDGTTVTISGLDSLASGTTVKVRVTCAATDTYTEAYADYTLSVNTAAITGSVSISGTNQVGSTLTVDTNSITPSDATLTYQWYSTPDETLSDLKEIDGATSDTYVVDESLEGFYVYVIVTATKDNYTSATFNDITDDSTNGSGVVIKVTKSAGYVNLSATTGTASYGASSATFYVTNHHGGTLTATEVTSTGATAKITTSMYMGTTVTISNISGLAGGTIVKIRVTSSETDTYTAASKDYTLTINYPTIRGGVKITGTNTVGETLSADMTSLDPQDATLSYQWYYQTSPYAYVRTAITGATNKTYVIDESLVGKYIYVIVTASKDNYVTTTFKDITDSTNNGSSTVIGADITGSVSISGVNEIGKTLTVISNIIPSDCTLGYQWYSNTTNSIEGGTPIDGAINQSYIVGDNLVGKYIYVIVTATKVNYATKTFTDITDEANNVSETVIDTSSYMITEWTISGDNTEIKLPVKGTGVNVIVDWGDGSSIETVTTEFPTHTYAVAGTYDIRVRGTLTSWGYSANSSVNTTSNYYTYTQYLTGLKQWGELGATSYGFSQCANLKYVSGDATENTFANVTSMSRMFYNCRLLASLDLSNFNTSNVNNMYGMFYGCSSLTNLDLNNFNTINVTDMAYMFWACSSLTSLDLSNFDTSNVTDMCCMFVYCSDLTSLDVSNFNTNNVTDMAYMFFDCSSLTSLDVSNFNTSNVIDMDAMFYGCSSLTNLELSNFNTSNVTDMAYMFWACSSLTSLDLSNFDTSNVTDMESMFDDCISLTNLNLSNFNTENVTNMREMFDDCTSLISLDVSNFNTENVTNMREMFDDCISLTSLDVSNFDTSNVTDMRLMFDNCSSLTSLNVSNFDTSNVTDMSYMFYGCSSLKNLDVSNFDTNNVTDMYGMFSYCDTLTSIDVSNFDTSNVIYMRGMFYGCNNLVGIDLSNFNTSNAIDMKWMFYDCTNLKSLQLSNKFKIPTSGDDTSVYGEMFSGDSNLSAIILVDETPLASQFTNVKDQLDGKTFYVPNKVAENLYETSWSGDFSGDRIEPMLKLIGEANIQIPKDSVYSDVGYTVAGFGIESSGDYTVYGYNVATSGDVDTSIAGIYEVTYSLTRNYMSGDTALTADISTETRNVEVIDMHSYMITEWTIPSGDTEIKLPVQGTGLNIEVDWGDGTTETITGNITAENFPMHTYSTSDEYDISIRGTCPKWGYNGWSAITETSPYYTYTQYLTKVKQFGELSATQYGFSQCKNLTEVSGENLVTSKTFEKTTSMADMFYACTSLTSLDVSNFDTSNVTDMSGMFDSCSSLTSPDVSNFDTSNVTDMDSMFRDCSSLTSLDVSNFDTSNVTNMIGMFFNCSSLTRLDVSNFDTSNVTSMIGMFNNCSSLTSLDVRNFDTSNVKNMALMFYGCSGLTSLNLSGVDTSNVTSMWGMFSGCSNLTSLDVSNFDTSKVTNMSYMFCYCSKLASIDVSNFDTSSVTNMSMMFFSCSDLTNLNVSNFNTSNVKTMEGMFGKCTSLKMIDVSNFETSKVTEMSGMFDNCKSLTTINVTNFDTSNVKYMLQMFSSCSGVTNLDLSSFDTSNVTDMSNMFYDCTNLKSLQLSNKFAIPTSNYSSMFSSTSNLSAIILIDETPLAGQFTNIKAQLDGKTFYVPSKVAETAYETSWSADFSGDRIQPILELVGVENVTIKVGETYTDAGYTIAGFTKADSGAYTCYGYSVSSSGEVNTAVAGKYKITYKVTRTYEKDGQTITTQPYEVTREITVMALPLTKPTLIGTYTYNGLIQTAQLKTVNESRFEITNNTRKDAGTQEITVSIKDKNTYAWEDGTTDDVKITWEIKPIIAEITWSATTIEYDGTAKTVTATVSNAVNGEVITVIEYEGTTTAVNVGEYTAKVKSLSSTNYTLEGAVNTEKKWYIQVTVIDMQVIMKDYSYGGTLPTPSITNNSAGRKVTYYYSENDTNQGGTDWSTVKDSLALPVGTYYMYAIVEANQNYQETITDPVSFKVLGTELKVSVTKENKIEYDGNWVNQNVYIYITVEGNANVTAYQYKIGTNGSWIDKVTSPVILQNNMNGEVIVRGVNPAGKAVTSEKSAGLIKIDKTVPSITNVSYKNENKELSITATINDNLSGITAYAITAENGIREWIESTQGTKQAIVDGSGTYTIWAKDEAGNIGHETIDVVKDIHAPVGTIIVKDAYTAENNIYYTNQMNVILQITATDDISTSNQIKMAIYKEDDYNALTSEDEIVWEQYKENKQWTLTKENADEKIYLILKDMAGNISVKVGK